MNATFELVNSWLGHKPFVCHGTLECMTATIIAIIIFGIIISSLLVLILLRQNDTKDAVQDDKGLRYLQNQLDNLHTIVEDKLDDSQKGIDEQIKEIIREVGNLKATNKEVLNFTDQLQDLQNILKNPKQRGVLGEYFLQTLLENVLPISSYQMQYEFKDGEKVDAVVFIDKKIIPIDSKFSLENYNRLMEAGDKTEKDRLEKIFLNDLKLRITETAKYIRPAEGTMDFAFMFIPHEAIYYDLLINKIGALTEDNENLLQRAAGKYKVIIVSPTSFLAYLQTVMQGLKAMHIEETSKDIVKRVGELGVHLKKYEEYHNKLGNSLSTVFNHYTDSSKELKKVDKDIVRITGDTTNIDPMLLDKPNFDEE